MGHDDYSGHFFFGFDQASNNHRGTGIILMGRRLVDKDIFRTIDQCPGKINTLTLAAGEKLNLFASQRSQIQFGEGLPAQSTQLTDVPT